MKVEVSSLRYELQNNKDELEKVSEESQSKSDEIVDIKSELQRYLSEVKRFEELIDLKDNERSNLLRQYEELSKEASAFESSNRSLGELIIIMLLDSVSVPDGKSQGGGAEGFFSSYITFFPLKVSNIYIYTLFFIRNQG